MKNICSDTMLFLLCFFCPVNNKVVLAGENLSICLISIYINNNANFIIQVPAFYTDN